MSLKLTFGAKPSIYNPANGDVLGNTSLNLFCCDSLLLGLLRKVRVSTLRPGGAGVYQVNGDTVGPQLL